MTRPKHEFCEPDLTFCEVAKTFHVSSCTIRNWIKTGYLVKGFDGKITRKSFNHFLKNVAGKKKLHSRANKSFKDKSSESCLRHEFFSQAGRSELSGDNLSADYELSLTNSYKNRKGIYYTPPAVTADLLKSVDAGDLSGRTFCDPACGSGNFIVEAVKTGFRPENLCGFDTDPVAVEITKKRIKDLTGYQNPAIFNMDFLSYMLSGASEKYDFIFTNPPWGKKGSKNVKTQSIKKYRAGKSTDSSALFFLASLVALNDKGMLGFLLPESFFHVGAFTEVRQRALEYDIERVVNYGNVFRGLMTEARAVILKKEKSRKKKILCQQNQKTDNQNKHYKHYRTKASFKNNPKSVINMHCLEADSRFISHLFSLKHMTLKGRARWGLGIVTGSNQKYCVSQKLNGYVPVYRGSDIMCGGLKSPSTYIPGDLTLYQQTAPKTLYEAEEKIIYKFISSKLCFFCDNRQRYILNSANMFVLNKDFPIKSAQLSALLNSRFMNWLFFKIFKTHKILRADLESLPIHAGYFEHYNKFSEEKYLDYLNIIKTDHEMYVFKNG